MDQFSLAKMYIDAVKNDSIESTILVKLPELVTCNDWTRVEIIGTVNYLSDRTKIVYNGLLVKHAGGLYYMKKKITDALGDIDKRFKNIKKNVRVITE